MKRLPDGTGRTYAPRARLPKGAVGLVTHEGPFPVSETLEGKKLLVIGGTGFLGKVLLSLLLKRFDLAHIYLMVRPKTGLTPEDRFFSELWPSPCFDPLREGRSEQEAEQWVRGKVTPIVGDVTRPRAGIDEATLERLRHEGVDAVLNVAGVVSFTPPIDEAFEVNALGVLHLVELCKELAGGASGVEAAAAVPLLHTSTCYVAGHRIGEVPEEDPRLWPFPRCDRLDRSHWDPRRELDEGLQIAAQVRARLDDAQLQSHFEDTARQKLRERHQPTTGEPFQEAMRRERERYLDEKLVEVGTARAAHWGWPNTYTYTKAVGEQLLASSGIPFTIVRPAIVESSLDFPVAGWNEGINTSAPLIYMALHGQVQYPSREGHVMDFIPVDHVCAGLVLCTAALLRREHAMVHQLGTSDANPFTMHRLIELTGLAKRRYMRSRRRGNPLLNRVYALVQPHPVNPEVWERQSAPAMQRAVSTMSRALRALGKTPAAPLASSLDRSLAPVSKQLKGSEAVMRAFLPFISELNYRFRADNTRALYERCEELDRRKLAFEPHLLDWRSYLLEVHIPGLRKWVFPHLEARLFKRPRAEERFSDLIALLDEVAEREGGRVALQRLDKQAGGVSLDAVTYRSLRRRAYACAARLADIGVHPGAKVALVARNAPEWGIAFFGVLAAGASVVPLDPNLDSDELGRRIERVGAEFALLGRSVAAIPGATCLDLEELCAAPSETATVTPPEVWVGPDDVAVVAYTAGTMGSAKPVLLTHKNLTAVLASVAPLFKISRRDSGLSVLPLHQTFELTCGLLLPLLRGAHVTYVDEVSADALSDAFQHAGITAMIGVPQVWEELEEKIYAELNEAGPFAEAAFQAGLVLNRTLGRALGLNLGRVLFRPVHDRLGGRIRFMLSTGGHLPRRTADTFKQLGIELRQGYGLTEAAPVMTLGDSRGRSTPVPGVEVEVRDVTEDGVGEIVTRGDHVMLGYLGDDENTGVALGPDGWLRTGDLGRIDREGRITLVARHNEVITLRGGRRVYPRALEERIEALSVVEEAAVVGIPDGQGGERVAALVVPVALPRRAEESDDEWQSRRGSQRELARRRCERALREVSDEERPKIIEVQWESLPRTSDRKVKRPEVIARIVALQAAVTTVGSDALSPTTVRPSLEKANPRRRARLLAPGQRAPREDEDLAVPSIVQTAVRGALLQGQMGFYRRGLRVTISGEQYIPHNRQTIVASNHASHLDMGLIKYALGSYGQDLTALAAKDYFFEGKWRRAYFENFTNLRPLDRADNPREAMREASGLLDRGATILLFPEGTRTTTGEMGEFRPAVAYLALRHGVDILPIFVDGTHRAMPRGTYVPRNRNVEVRIGPPIPAAALQAAVQREGLRPSAASQKVTLVLRRAVECLRDERRFDLDAAIAEALGSPAALNGDAPVLHAPVPVGAGPASPLAGLFRDLEGRFCPDEVKRPVTYYFSLGQGPDTKWTVQVRKDGCTIVNGKLDGAADCVMKTDVGMFTRIIREHYIPQVSEFLDGTVKTNDPELLTTFVQVFNL
ncbi:MAG: AMP-binding protein [Myxococcota bacterium]